MHSYLAVPLIARGEVLGALDLKRPAIRCRSARTTCCWPGSCRPRGGADRQRPLVPERPATPPLTLQRSLLPSHPPVTGGLEVASPLPARRGDQRGRRRLVRRDRAGGLQDRARGG
ncbi:hypothetical protein LV779_02465 [Streptomyces thinghirensis]|nr:hypothetical protein [Streptomyces thinghirensis]